VEGSLAGFGQVIALKPSLKEFAAESIFQSRGSPPDRLVNLAETPRRYCQFARARD
jgi:hypothetical protein